ncbi:DUF1269 domain-containing protein [Methylibium sp. Pch-M]|uniref:DUF1269 domain-containing protein n=1 Tax=Methylibium sp. Pch-M TaxID=2082386 RepID=UPI00101166C0|nr:DUF1269 domain-containing protein [Methylibium sp. Pch-M]QAZ39395.1 DUF1269 domain-containing protein [Methylibium sp. Pch-M]
MRRRIYWLLPDLTSARRTMNDLLLARIGDAHIHFVARENADLSGLHAANLLQTSDLLRSAQAGLVIGGLGGAVIGVLAAMFFPIVGGAESGLAALRAVFASSDWSGAELRSALDSPQWAMAAVLAVLGGLLGAWSSSMIGIAAPSGRLRRFEGALADGQLLLMVDVPRSRVQEIESLLQATHPEAHFEGVEPDVPAFP